MGENNKEIERIIKELEAIYDSKPNHSYLETRVDEQILGIGGNSEGLILLAMQVLRIAGSGKVGTHFHYDKLSNLDHCEKDFIIQKVSPDWENK